MWNGVTYNSSGLYDSLFVNSQGCDSLAQIYLTIIQPIITNLTESLVVFTHLEELFMIHQVFIQIL